MKTTIIIPNYNGLSFMEPCFEALDRQTTKDFKILVVDNGSTDGSVEWLKEKQIPSIFLPENTGFSGAVNVGIKAADTPYVILLNNEYEKWLRTMWKRWSGPWTGRRRSFPSAAR